MGWNDHIPDLREAALGILVRMRRLFGCVPNVNQMFRCGDADAESLAYAMGTNMVNSRKIRCGSQGINGRDKSRPK